MSLSSSDLQQFSKLLDDSLERKLSPLKDQISTLPTKEEVAKITSELSVLRKIIITMPTKYHLSKLKDELLDKISHLPTKEQFYKKMDKWMKATTTHDLEKSAHKRAHSLLKEHLASPHIL